jgi:hypothetical protein
MGNKIRKGNVRYIKQSILLNEHYDTKRNFRNSLLADFKPYPQTSFLAAPEKARHVYRLLQAYYEDTVRLA